MAEGNDTIVNQSFQGPGLDLDAVQQFSNQRVVMVVEDDHDTLNLLKLTLRSAGMNVVGAYDGKQAIRKWTEANPNIVLLDLMMPEMDGWDTLGQLRAISDTPIIILSALGQIENIVRGLNEGADDYITKPFQNNELVARVEAALRRAGPQKDTNHLLIPEHNLIIDLETHQVSLSGKDIELTPREFSVFAALAKRHPKPVAYQNIAEEIWGEDSPKIRERIKWIVYLLRQKIEDDPKAPQIILNKVRFGYLLAAE